MKKEKIVAWCSRHNPTIEQLQEISKKGWVLLQDNKLKELFSKNVTENVEVRELVDQLVDYIKERNIDALVGVFAAPIRAELFARAQFDSDLIGLELYEAWNIKRTEEGKSPIFQHKKFVLTQIL